MMVQEVEEIYQQVPSAAAPYADGASDSAVRGTSQRQGVLQGGDCPGAWAQQEDRGQARRAAARGRPP